MNKHALIILAAAFLLSAAYSLFVPQPPVVADADEYDTIGWNIATGRGFSYEPGTPTPARAPFYPFMLSIIYAAAGHSHTAVRLVQCFLAALTCLLTYLIAFRLFGSRIAAWAGWLTAVYPVLIAYAGMILSETLFTFLLCATLWFLIEGHSQKGKQMIFWSAAGLTLGLATLTRATTILFPAAVLLMAIIGKDRRSLAPLALSFIAFAVTLVPWTVRNYRAFGVLMPVSTGGGVNICATGRMLSGATWDDGIEYVTGRWHSFRALPPMEGEREKHIAFDQQLKSEGKALIQANPAAYIKLVMARIPRFWLTSHSAVFGIDRSLSEYQVNRAYGPIAIRLLLLFFHGALLAATAIGMYLARFSFRSWAILLITFLYFNMHILFDPCNRYLVPVMPYIMIFTAVFFGTYYAPHRKG